MWRAETHGRKGKSACGVYLPDLEQPRPPDAPPGMVKLRLVKKDELFDLGAAYPAGTES
jgi:hypothetical protein